VKKVSIILIFCLFSVLLSYAQEESCHAPRFIPGTYARVVGSLDSGGLAYRNRPELDEEILGFYPIGTTLETNDAERCINGRVWYRVKPISDESTYFDWVTDGDENSYWLEPIGFCIRDGILLYTGGFFGGDIAEMNYDTETNRLLIAIRDFLRSDNPWPLLKWYSIQLDTGEYTSIPYPYADMATEELTDLLGLTPLEFERSFSEQRIYVSPDKSRILYFQLGEAVEGACAHHCQPLEMFSANADGSNPIYIGQSSTELFMWSLVWGANNRIYPSFMPEVSPALSTAEICLDGTCRRSLSDALRDYGVPEELAALNARASVSPNGRYLAVSTIYQPVAYVVDTQTGALEMLPDKGGISLPPIWSSNRSLYLAIDHETRQDQTKYSTWADTIIEFYLSLPDMENTGGSGGYALSQRRIFENEVPKTWLISSDYRHVVVSGSVGGTGIYCMGRG
jgi:hypothetical protein